MALLHQFRRLAVRWERYVNIHDSLVTIACALICWRRLINWEQSKIVIRSFYFSTHPNLTA